MRIIGVDVSHWEGSIDWQEASHFVPWCYFKCTDGVGGVDYTFDLNRKGCQQNGIPHAPYHYYQPGQDPATQADHFIAVAGKDFKRYIVDVEEEEGVDDKITSDVLVFLLRVAQLTGRRPAIYTSAGYWNQFIKPKPAWSQSYELIVAHYTAEHTPILPIGWSTWTAWQFSDHFFFPGCYSAADGDWFAGSLDQVREWFGNYRPVEPVTYSFHARSLFDQLHVRSSPSTLAKEIDHLNKGETVEIEQLGGQDVWVRHAQGWTCVEKAGYRYMEIIK